MKSVISLALVLLVSVTTFAAGKNSQSVNPAAVKRAKLGTSFKFDGSALRGKYQSSMNTAATVENDKLLEDLLKGRTQFEDRINEELERN
ncbi:hypothetical protein [Bdellovibrio reynosensis]|uniref:Uncharacterized protein n=1 Tax=Bdellovibrio reynosensis TaxID=2835041 RepID=A0ABY4CBE9_9BACT|nr:hypothetical protein [Bdellovibrio reynosensis]UOF02302.1 hypothetical protein MNR06_04975 [Bdellovibrio reynosensis]